MDDLDPGKADSVGDLAACLRHLRRCAGEPSYRALEQKTIHASGFLPGTRLERVRLARSTLSDVLNGRKFPRKAFVLTLVEALNVDLVADHRWGHAWDQLAVRDQQADPAAEEAERLRLENEELRQRLAEAGYQAGAASTSIRAALPATSMTLLSGTIMNVAPRPRSALRPKPSPVSWPAAAARSSPTYRHLAAATSTSCSPRRCRGSSCARSPGRWRSGSPQSTRRRCRVSAARSHLLEAATRAAGGECCLHL